MKSFVSVRSVATATVALILSTAATVWLAMLGYYPYLVVSVTGICISVLVLLRLYTRSVRKAVFMFDAIDNDDFSFAFSEDKLFTKDVMLNEVLNRMKDILINAKQQVRDKEKFYALIMDSVRTGIITVNEAGNIYHVNNEAMRIFGLQVFTHINQLNTVEPAVREAIASLGVGEKAQVSFTNERGDVSISLVASEIPMDDQMLKIISITDINNELAEKELESWMRLTRILTHEIMNSLSPITSLSDTLIGMTNGESREIVKGLKTINTTSRSLISFVDSYRKFTFIPAPTKTLFAVAPFLDRIIHLHSQQWGGEISCAVNPDDILVYADEDLVGQVVLNILRNAAQAVAEREQPRIWVESYVDDNENVIVEISNNGGAIPAQIAENIFMPFFTTKQEGSGVGLSISRQVMRLHGGSVRLTTNTDERVTFSLLF